MSYEILSNKIKKDVTIKDIRFIEFDYIVKKVKIKANSDIFSDGKNLGSGKLTVSLKLGYNYFTNDDNKFTLFRKLPKKLLGKEKYRPKFHYTVPFSLLNDPNGLFYNDDEKCYNIYHQYQGNYFKGCEYKSWAHAKSKDLIHYDYLPIALFPDELGEVYSGSCIIDKENTSGLFNDNVKPADRIVAFYTAFDGIEKQCLAYSNDGGKTFIKFKGNPILPNMLNGKQIYTLGYRDPKVIRAYTNHHKNGIWFMIVAGEQARLYSSTNLIEWTLNCEFVYPDNKKIISECPDFFPMTDNNGKEKWIFIGNNYNDGNSYIFYTVGHLEYSDEKYKYIVESATDNYLNVNPECYASQTISNAPNGRSIMIAWMRDWVLFDGNMWNFDNINKKSKYWLGTLTLPVDLKLVDNSIKILPAKELESLRKKQLKIKNKGNLFKINHCGNLLEIDIENTTQPVSVLIKCNNQQEIYMTYNGNEFCIDKSKTSAVSIAKYNTKLYSKPFSAKFLIDTSIIEGYLNNGEKAFNLQYYVDKIISLEISCDNAKVYKLKQTVKVIQI